MWSQINSFLNAFSVMNMAPIILPLIIQGQGWKDFSNHEVKTLILQEGELAPEWESK